MRQLLPLEFILLMLADNPDDINLKEELFQWAKSKDKRPHKDQRLYEKYINASPETQYLIGKEIKEGFEKANLNSRLQKLEKRNQSGQMQIMVSFLEGLISRLDEHDDIKRSKFRKSSKRLAMIKLIIESAGKGVIGEKLKKTKNARQDANKEINEINSKLSRDLGITNDFIINEPSSPGYKINSSKYKVSNSM